MRSWLWVLGLVGCVDASPEAQCERAAACAADDAEVDPALIDVCVAYLQAVEDEAADAGCAEPYEALVRCTTRHTRCEDGSMVPKEGTCEGKQEDLDTCYESGE